MELESLDCFDCACDTYIRVVTADSITVNTEFQNSLPDTTLLVYQPSGVRCSAKTVRGTAVTRCWEMVTSSFESPDLWFFEDFSPASGRFVDPHFKVVLSKERFHSPFPCRSMKIAPNTWSDGELLLAAIASNESELVTVLREAGCSVHRSHLQAFAKCYTPSHLDALMIESEYGLTLMDQDLLVELTEQKCWSYVLRSLIN
ncbi:hypothetical protein ANCDUO_01963 [Ancylostoma duodenale]|uniref:Uncharacterized protein n=1 Tax=Ancylostoma duodenale TaxID=51022 RepID=A0A0C2H7Z6_9BILA|nr:hypothetical protein ANCDUO_01963 [Ancylostoma duodenale]